MNKTYKKERNFDSESKKDYLRRILNVKRGDAGYSDMDTYIKEYNNFMKTLNYNSTRGGEEEKLFIYFHKNNLTPFNIVKKEIGKIKLKENLKELLKKSNEYYDKKLYPEYREKIKMMSPSDFQIELSDKKRNNSVVGILDNVDEFINYLDNKWNEFTYYLYIIIYLVFDVGNYKQNSVQDFGSVVNEEIEYYKKKVKQYYCPYNFDDDDLDDEFENRVKNKIIYYTSKNNNPYKNLYIYCISAYIKNFYVIDIPLIDINKPFGFKNIKKLNINCLMNKNTFSLADIAEVYSILTDCDKKKAYGKIKQQFRKSFYMQKYKYNGEYKFDKLEVPLATYAYYSKKNHIEPNPILATYSYLIISNNDDFELIPYDVLYQKWFNDLWENFKCEDFIQQYNPLITFVYAPLLRSALLGENDKLLIYNKFYAFITSEFKNALKIVDDARLKFFIELIMECTMRLYYRCIGMDINSICG